MPLIASTLASWRSEFLSLRTVPNRASFSHGNRAFSAATICPMRRASSAGASISSAFSRAKESVKNVTGTEVGIIDRPQSRQRAAGSASVRFLPPSLGFGIGAPVDDAQSLVEPDDACYQAVSHPAHRRSQTAI